MEGIFGIAVETEVGITMPDFLNTNYQYMTGKLVKLQPRLPGTVQLLLLLYQVMGNGWSMGPAMMNTPENRLARVSLAAKPTAIPTMPAEANQAVMSIFQAEKST